MKVELISTGFIHSPHSQSVDTPIQSRHAAGIESTLEVFTAFTLGLRGLDGFNRIWLVYWFHRVLGAALAFCAGTFLCIACADLLPELQFHKHDRVKLSLALLLGIAVAWLIISFGHVRHEHHRMDGLL